MRENPRENNDEETHREGYNNPASPLPVHLPLLWLQLCPNGPHDTSSPTLHHLKPPYSPQDCVLCSIVKANYVVFLLLAVWLTC